MQIKFNKLKPTAKLDEQKSAPVQQNTVQNPQKSASVQQSTVHNQQKPAPQQSVSKMDELPKPPKADEAKAAPTAPTASAVSAAADSAFAAAAVNTAPKASAEPTAPAASPAPAPVTPVSPVPPVPVSAESKPMGVRIEDTLKKFLHKPVRVYMADHEYVSGRLDIVEDGWIKICNARSAGSDYYFDEDIINTVNVVRVRVSLTVEKEKYVDFMNEANKL